MVNYQRDRWFLILTSYIETCFFSTTEVLFSIVQHKGSPVKGSFNGRKKRPDLQYRAILLKIKRN